MNESEPLPIVPLEDYELQPPVPPVPPAPKELHGKALRQFQAAHAREMRRLKMLRARQRPTVEDMLEKGAQACIVQIRRLAWKKSRDMTDHDHELLLGYTKNLAMLTDRIQNGQILRRKDEAGVIDARGTRLPEDEDAPQQAGFVPGREIKPAGASNGQ